MPTYTLEQPAGDGAAGADGDKPKKQYTLIPEGTWVDATVSKVEEQEKPYNDDDGVPVRKVVFEFAFSWEGEDRKTWGETSTKFVYHPGCKLRNWAQEILVAELPEEFVLDTDHLQGMPCRVQLEVHEWDTPKSKGAKNRAKDVMRPRGTDLTSAQSDTEAKSDGYIDPF